MELDDDDRPQQVKNGIDNLVQRMSPRSVFYASRTLTGTKGGVYLPAAGGGSGRAVFQETQDFKEQFTAD